MSHNPQEVSNNVSVTQVPVLPTDTKAMTEIAALATIKLFAEEHGVAFIAQCVKAILLGHAIAPRPVSTSPVCGAVGRPLELTRDQALAIVAVLELNVPKRPLVRRQ